MDGKSLETLDILDRCEQGVNNDIQQGLRDFGNAFFHRHALKIFKQKCLAAISERTRTYSDLLPLIDRLAFSGFLFLHDLLPPNDMNNYFLNLVKTYLQRNLTSDERDEIINIVGRARHQVQFLRQ